MKTKDELKELAGMTPDQRIDELEKASRELLNLNFRKAVSGLPKPSELARLRKRIARIKTVSTLNSAS